MCERKKLFSKGFINDGFMAELTGSEKQTNIKRYDNLENFFI